jgi:hypothetical protein
MLILVVMDFSRMMINRFRKPKPVEVKMHPVKKTKKSKPADTDEESHHD